MCFRGSGDEYHQHGQERPLWSDQKKRRKKSYKGVGTAGANTLRWEQSGKKANGLKQNNRGVGWWKDDLFAQNDQERGNQCVFYDNREQSIEDLFNSGENLAH